MGVGILLIAIAFIFQPTSPQKPAITSIAASQPESPAPLQQEKELEAHPAINVTPEPSASQTMEIQPTPVAKLEPEPKPVEPEPEPEPKPVEPEPEPEPKPEPEVEEPVQETQAQEESPVVEEGSSGWIYAGQFMDGQWLERGLIIGNELPADGKRYSLSWGANVRAAPPGKETTLSKTVNYLPQGQQVDIVQVKKSGNKGHVWIKIK
ncbi:MAG: hypothetical protein KJ914_16015 [Gammaproteobacteria bacterium]|nr:hypothetical protein [Gammaproteobacteria bacterium]MBU2006770.1 hypothetical protein [Gammaproteobacteria bacterium]